VSISADILARPDSTYPIQIKPYKLDISQFGDKVRDEMKFTISNVSDLDLELKLVAYPVEFASVELPKSIQAGKSASGTVKLTSAGIESDFEKSFTLELNDEPKSRFTVPIKRTVKSPVAAGNTPKGASAADGEGH